MFPRSLPFGNSCSHFALINAEIIALIVENSCSFDLLSLALVSRRISPHALQVLWRVLPSPVPLLKLLPHVSFAGGSCMVATDSHSLDWATFDYYSPFVHYFLSAFSTHYTYHGLCDIDPGIFLLLQRLRPTLPLFPQIRSFVLPLNHISTASITPFLSPSLEVAFFHTHPDSAVELDVLLSKSPHLLKLSLSGNLSQSALELLPRFKHLKALELLYPSWESYTRYNCALSQAGLLSFIGNSHLFNDLTNLSLAIPAGTPHLPVGLFPSVKNLKIFAETSAIVHILTTTHSLEKAVLDSIDAETEEWIAIFTALSATSAVSLRSVIIGARDSPIHLCGCLQPLLKCSLLAFEITTTHRGTAWNISDDDIRDIVQGWPLLRRFVLPEAWAKQSGLSSRSLHLLSSLHHLDILRIGIGCTVICMPRDPLCENRIDDLMNAYLEQVFPKYSRLFQ